MHRGTKLTVDESLTQLIVDASRMQMTVAVVGNVNLSITQSHIIDQTLTHLLKHFKISKMSSGPYISKNALRAKVLVKKYINLKRSRK